MGQFKPMVKMTTTEPSVELKLKSGGKVEKKMQMGGALAATPAAGPAMRAPARGGMMPAAAPGKPSMAARRRAMMAGPTGAAPAGPMGMAGRMMKDGGEATSLKAHAGMPASKAHKGLKTGGVVDGQGGYKAGGIIKTMTNKTTKMDTAKPDHSPAKTGDVKMGNGGGYKDGGMACATGGVIKANGGGYKKGGAAKKAYATGGLVDSGRPVAMPQGAKKPSTPVSINQLSGTFKKGGKVTAAQGRLQKISNAENAPAMKQAKAYSNEVYSKYGKKMKDGGKVADTPPKGVEDTIQTARNERAYKAWEKSQAEENKAMSQGVGSLISSIPRKLKEVFSPAKAASAPGAVTKTEKSVTVTPKKRGGAVTC
jgi:hypothetical protein